MLKKIEENLYVMSGKAMYCIVNEPKADKDFNGNMEYRFRTDLIIDDADYKPFNSLLKSKKVRQEMKEDEESKQGMFQFRRVALMEGKNPLNPPEVVDKDKKTHDTKVAIGNGSDVLVCFEFVPTKKAGSFRVVLNSLQILNLVPYVSEPVPPPPPSRPGVFDKISEEDLPF